MRQYGNRIPVTAYLDEALYNKIETERSKTKVSQSSFITCVLESVFCDEDDTQKVGAV